VEWRGSVVGGVGLEGVMVGREKNRSHLPVPVGGGGRPSLPRSFVSGRLVGFCYVEVARSRLNARAPTDSETHAPRVWGCRLGGLGREKHRAVFTNVDLWASLRATRERTQA